MAKSKSVNMLKAMNPMNLYGFWKVMVEAFGLKFSLLLVSNYFGIKGALKEFSQAIELPLYREGGWDSSVKQVNSAVSQLPNAMKGFASALSDLFPIFGYEKGSYVIIYSLLSAICILCFIIFDLNINNVSDKVPAILFAGLYLQSANLDILLEGKYAEIMKQSPTSRGTVISFTYFLITIGGFVPGLTVGNLAAIIHVRYIFLIAFPFAVQPIFFILAGCMINDKARPERNNRFDYVKAKQFSSILILTITIATGSLISAIIGLLSTSFVQFVYCLVAAIIVAILAYYFLPILVASANVYIFLNQTLYLDFSGPLDYFYMGDPLCVPNGPNFGYAYYKSWVVIVGVIAQLGGIWIFQSVITHWKYRPIFWITTCLRCAASIFDIVIINRWNVAIGIPDEVTFMLGNTIIYQACYMMDFLPATLLIAKVVPKHIETSLFAVLAGYGNFGQAVGKFVGNALVESFGVKMLSEGPGCVYDNLTYVILIGHFALPLIQVPLTFFLIPDKYVHEDLVEGTFQNPRYLFSRKPRDQTHKVHVYSSNSDPSITI